MTTKTRTEKMEETRAKLISSARKAFAEQGFAAASMDVLTAQAGLTRGALYHNFGDKKGLLAAVISDLDREMVNRASAAVAQRKPSSAWEKLVEEGVAYMELALDPEIQRIVLLDGPAYLGDPSQWPSQNECLHSTVMQLQILISEGIVKSLDPEIMARLINGAALSAALWVASSASPQSTLPKAISGFRALMSGFLAS